MNPQYMNYPPAPPKKRGKAKWIALALVGAFFIVCSIGAISSLFTTPDKLTTSTGEHRVPEAPPGVSPSPYPSPGMPVAGPPKPKSTKVIVKEGEWLVGKDIPAGTYRTEGADDSGYVLWCYWSVRQSDETTAHYLDSGAVDSAQEPGRVSVKKGNVFKTSGCKAWVKQ